MILSIWISTPTLIIVHKPVRFIRHKYRRKHLLLSFRLSRFEVTTRVLKGQQLNPVDRINAARVDVKVIRDKKRGKWVVQHLLPSLQQMSYMAAGRFETLTVLPGCNHIYRPNYIRDWYAKGQIILVDRINAAQVDEEVIFSFNLKWANIPAQDVCRVRGSTFQGGVGPFGLLTLTSKTFEVYSDFKLYHIP
ncbi:Beta-fructofuranosidase, insoluble isoenzyme 1 [Linum grandiflorum]